MNDNEKGGLFQAASAAHTVHSAVKTAKAVSAAKGAAVGDVRFTDGATEVVHFNQMDSGTPTSPTA